eukprot:689252-Hanusia_phi.AAC.1
MVAPMHIPRQRCRPPVCPAGRELLPSIQRRRGDRLVEHSVGQLRALLLAVVLVTCWALEPGVREGGRDPSCMPAPLIEERTGRAGRRGRGRSRRRREPRSRTDTHPLLKGASWTLPAPAEPPAPSPACRCGRSWPWAGREEDGPVPWVLSRGQRGGRQAGGRARSRRGRRHPPARTTAVLPARRPGARRIPSSSDVAGGVGEEEGDRAVSCSSPDVSRDGVAVDARDARVPKIEQEAGHPPAIALEGDESSVSSHDHVSHPRVDTSQRLVPQLHEAKPAVLRPHDHSPSLPYRHHLQLLVVDGQRSHPQRKQVLGAAYMHRLPHPPPPRGSTQNGAVPSDCEAEARDSALDTEQVGGGGTVYLLPRVLVQL